MKKKLRGSALLWCLAVLIVLSIVTLSTIAVSMAYYKRCVKDAGISQMDYNIESAMEILIDELTGEYTVTGTDEPKQIYFRVNSLSSPIGLTLFNPTTGKFARATGAWSATAEEGMYFPGLDKITNPNQKDDFQKVRYIENMLISEYCNKLLNPDYNVRPVRIKFNYGRIDTAAYNPGYYGDYVNFYTEYIKPIYETKKNPDGSDMVDINGNPVENKDGSIVQLEMIVRAETVLSGSNKRIVYAKFVSSQGPSGANYVFAAQDIQLEKSENPFSADWDDIEEGIFIHEGDVGDCGFDFKFGTDPVNEINVYEDNIDMSGIPASLDEFLALDMLKDEFDENVIICPSCLEPISKDAIREQYEELCETLSPEDERGVNVTVGNKSEAIFGFDANSTISVDENSGFSYGGTIHKFQNPNLEYSLPNTVDYSNYNNQISGTKTQHLLLWEYYNNKLPTFSYLNHNSYTFTDAKYQQFTTKKTTNSTTIGTVLVNKLESDPAELPDRADNATRYYTSFYNFLDLYKEAIDNSALEDRYRSEHFVYCQLQSPKYDFIAKDEDGNILYDEDLNTIPATPEINLEGIQLNDDVTYYFRVHDDTRISFDPDCKATVYFQLCYNNNTNAAGSHPNLTIVNPPKGMKIFVFNNAYDYGRLGSATAEHKATDKAINNGYVYNNTTKTDRNVIIVVNDDTPDEGIDFNGFIICNKLIIRNECTDETKINKVFDVRFNFAKPDNECLGMYDQKDVSRYYWNFKGYVDQPYIRELKEGGKK